MILNVLVIALLVNCLAVRASTVSFQHHTMRMMWQTPIEQISLLNHGISARDLKWLANEIFQFYEDFQKAHRESWENEVATREATVSDRFYAYQQQVDLAYKRCLLANLSTEAVSQSTSHSKPFLLCPQQRPPLFDDLARIFHGALRHFCTRNQLDWSPPPLVIPQSSSSASTMTCQSEDEYFKLFTWTSIHGLGSHHAAHHHVHSAVSGVLYINTPPGSGDLVFFDPRGPLPPFGKTLHIRPQAGDLVLFPGYLMHSVEPSLLTQASCSGDQCSAEAWQALRISVSFNYDGSWELLSDINAGYASNGA
eukprot:gene14078-10057_t